jgi:hypothetical protein
MRLDSTGGMRNFHVTCKDITIRELPACQLEQYIWIGLIQNQVANQLNGHGFSHGLASVYTFQGTSDDTLIELWMLAPNIENKSAHA